MAYSAITVCKMTTVNSSISVVPTLTAVSTVSSGGAYIDCRNVDASKMILVVKKSASGANTASKDRFRILDGDSKAGYTNYGLGNLVIDMSSDAEDLCFAGPFETARFKDSDGRIDITCTRGTNVGFIGAILI